LLLFVLGKAVAVVQKLILPVQQHLPAEPVFGIGLRSLISLILVLLICFLAGLLVERKRVKWLITKLEDNILVFIPGYSMLKAQTGDIIINTDHQWQTVLLEEDDNWKAGVVVDRHPDGYCTVFFPEPPDAKSGELKLMQESKLKKLDMPVSKLVKIIRNYGHGAAELMKMKE
jgi:uncharacterized membrane protein